MDIEDQFIIRFPEEWVAEIYNNAALSINPTHLEGEEYSRTYEVLLGDYRSVAFLLDLPCIIESHKTFDYINFFKSSDLSQMLYVIPPPELDDIRNPSSTLSKMLIPGEKYACKSGISPGTYDITSRFFKKERKEDPNEVSRVESFIKSVMENGSAVIIEEELVELEEGQKTPSDREEVIYPEDLEVDMDLDVAN